MNNNDYPNRDALRKANDIYLDAMRSFIAHNLRQVQGQNAEEMIKSVLYDNQIDQFRQMLDVHKDICLAIDFTYIPHIIKKYWEEVFANKFENDLVAQNMLWIIRKGRNICEHRANDLDIEFAQAHLFLISDVLKIIKRTDKHDEVVNIHNELLYSDSEKKILELSDQIEKVETEKKRYNSKYLETKKQLEQIEKEHSENKKRIDELLKIKEEKAELAEANSKLSKELKDTEDAWNLTDMSLKSKEKQLNDEIKAHDSLKEQVSSLNGQIEAAENENNRYKTQLDDEKKSNKKQVESMSDKYAMLEKENEDYKARLNVSEKKLHLTMFPVFPSYDIDSSVRVLDRRNTDRNSYLTNLLELKQPSILYVDSEEKTEVFFTHIAGDKTDLIGRHNEHSSVSEENELLGKLADGDLIAIVSSATFATIPAKHVIKHFVFCHPILDLDEFCNQCQPAFMPMQNTYLHIIYDTKQEFDSYSQKYIKELDKKYPEKETLKELFKQLRDHVKANGNSVNLELLCQDLDMKITGVETGIAIFEELQFIERIDQEINLLESNKKQLEDSKIYSNGKKLKEKADRESYQLGMDSIENLWEKIHDTLDIEKKHLINKQEENTGRTKNGSQHETTVDESDSVETEQVVPPKNSGAKVNAEQVRVIRERAADGETLSILSREYGMSSTGIWNIVNRNTWKDIE